MRSPARPEPRRRTGAAGVLLAAALLAPSPFSTTLAQEDPAARLDEVEARMGALDARIEDRQISLGATNRALERIEAELAALSARRDRLQTERGELRTARPAAEAALERAARERDEAAARLGPDLTRLAALARRPAPLGVLLGGAARSGERPTPATDMALLRHFGAARLALVRRWQDALAHWDAEARRLRDLEDALERTASELDATGARLEAARQERETVAAELRAALRDDLVARKELEAVRARLAELVERLERASRTAPDVPFDSNRGGWPWPVPGDALRRFGASRGSGGPAWQGVLLDARVGEPVRSIAGGTVVFADWLRGYGQLVIVDHGRGWLSLYAHHSRIDVEVGERVGPGTVLARAGRTGGLATPAVYFEIRGDGEPVDPAEWCAARPA